MLGSVLLLFCIAGSVWPAESSVTPRRMARQWVGELETQMDCSFPVSIRRDGPVDRSPADRVSLCNFTLSGPQVDGVYSWQRGLASQANWLGGPAVDASKSSDGGYAFFETSSLSVQQLPGIHAKAWLKSPVYRPTTPNGHCLRFSYNIQGVSASQLRLLRVQMLPLEGHSAAPSHAAAPLIVNSILVPTTGQQQRAGTDAGASWTPYQSIMMNQTGWQEVVDEVWLSSDSTRGQWLPSHVTYSSPYPHAFIFEAVPNLAHLQYRGHVAVDDVTFTNGPCQAECEFNADFCDWSNDEKDDDFDWSLSRGSLWTNTGPIRDQLSSKHNFNFGGYAYIDSRQPHYAGSRAVLASERLPATVDAKTGSNDALCFVFWVHMFGSGIGRLRVVQDGLGNGTARLANKTEREIWRLFESGPRDSWYRAQVTLSSPTPFKIQLEATVGDSGYGDIAVDSFRIENGSCPGLPESAVNKGIDCTFQNGNCGWVVTNSQPGIASMWTRVIPDLFAGRPEGHAQQNVLSHSTNNYMLFDTYQNGHKAGSRGYVSSQLQKSNESQCISFWFYLASTSAAQPRIGSLEVVLYEPNVTLGVNATSRSTPVVSSTLWRLENHQEEKWLFAQVSFVASRGGYISFAGTRGDGTRGVLAIDDVTLYRGPCQTLPMDAVVSQLDCSFDLNLCSWTVDSKSVVLPAKEDVVATTTTSTSPPTEAPPTTVATLQRTNSIDASLLQFTDEVTSITDDVFVVTHSTEESTTEVASTTTVPTESPTTLSTTSTSASAVRGVSGLYDEVIPYGQNAIEVISTSREGSTKSIIISQPYRNRFRRSWIGYDKPRNPKIVSYRNTGAAASDDGMWQRPLPVPYWLRSRQPHPDQSTPTKLFALSSVPVSTIPHPLPPRFPNRMDTPRWTLSGSSSLFGIKDHTFQWAEGGYIMLEGSNVSRLFSPEFSGNATNCLSFFFAMVYNTPNCTLTVYRQSESGPMEELWRVTSAALDRSHSRLSSLWIPARVPILPSKTNQVVIIEGSGDGGGIALDDIRFKQVTCSSRP